MSLVALLWIALLQALVPAGSPTRANHADIRGSCAAAVPVGPRDEQPARAAARPGRTVRATPAFAERRHAVRPSLASFAAHLPRSTGGLPKGMSMGGAGTKTGAGWALVPVANPPAVARECGTADTAVDRTSRMAAARCRLLSYLPNPPPLG